VRRSSSFRRVEERLLLFGFDGDFENADRIVDNAVAGGGGPGNVLHDVEAFGDAAEDGILPVERGLGGDADEELVAVAVGFVGNADGGQSALHVFEIGDFGWLKVERAAAPEVFRSFWDS